MDILLKNRKLNGSVRIPSSKSLAHRYLICGALAKEPGSVISNVSMSEDILATINALTALGAKINVQNDVCTIEKCICNKGKVVINCNESGSTLRFMLPIALTVADEVEFIGRGRLLERPLTPYFDILDKQGISYKIDKDSLKIKGRLSGGRYEVPGNISSQFITGLLYLAVLSDQDVIIDVSTPLESINYVDITTHAFEFFGVRIERENNRFIIPGGRKFSKKTVPVEGDYSHAAFFLTAGALGNDVKVSGLRQNSLQGDKEILKILKETRANVTIDDLEIGVTADKLRPFEVDASNIPDLVPILAVLACGIKGQSKILNASRLRLKESDRLFTTANELNVLGASVIELEDGLVINGTGSLKSGTVKSHNDHRIAMALSIASTICTGNVIIKNAECVAKSYPLFFEHIISLGGKYEYVG